MSDTRLPLDCPTCGQRAMPAMLRETGSRESAMYADALERTDQALRALLAGKPVRDADEILSHNAFLLFAAPSLEEAS